MGPVTLTAEEPSAAVAEEAVLAAMATNENITTPLEQQDEASANAPARLGRHKLAQRLEQPQPKSSRLGRGDARDVREPGEYSNQNDFDVEKAYSLSRPKEHSDLDGSGSLLRAQIRNRDRTVARTFLTTRVRGKRVGSSRALRGT